MTPHRNNPPIAPLSDSGMRPVTVADRGLLIYDVGLLLFRPEIVIGTDRAPCSTTQVDLKFLGDLRTHHAKIIRQAGRYSIRAFPKAQSSTSVNGQALSESRQLTDQDCIILGNNALVMIFHQAESDSGTAILEIHRVSSSVLNLPCGHLATNIALLDQELFIAPFGPAHFIVATLPCRRLRFYWSNGHLHTLTQGRDWRDDAGVDGEPRVIHVPELLPITAPRRNADDPECQVITALFGLSAPPHTILLSLEDPYSTTRKPASP